MELRAAPKKEASAGEREANETDRRRNLYDKAFAFSRFTFRRALFVPFVFPFAAARPGLSAQSLTT